MFDERRLDFLIRFGSYKVKYVVIRIFSLSLLSLSIFFFIEKITPPGELHTVRKEFLFLLGILAYNSVSEINLLLMRLLNRSKRLKWKIYLQIIIVISVTLLLAYFWFNLIQLIIGGNDNIILHGPTQIALLAGVLVIVIHLLIIIISNLLKEWIDNRKVIDELRQAKLLNDYNSLKDRLNPHFLFNNLSTLKSLIHYSPESAEIFTQNFTNVYRYVLKSHTEKTVPLAEELKFLKSYVALHKERIGEGLKIDINIDDSLLQKSIPPMSLQLLVENAIKHNVANKLHPLHIEIYTEKGMLIVKNNIYIKESTYSTKTGLQSIIRQYQLIADIEINIVKTEEYFKVDLPLI